MALRMQLLTRVPVWVALQMNRSLRTLVWDDNHTSVAALTTLSLALARSPSLRLIALPLHDLARCYRGTRRAPGALVRR